MESAKTRSARPQGNKYVLNRERRAPRSTLPRVRGERRTPRFARHPFPGSGPGSNSRLGQKQRASTLRERRTIEPRASPSQCTNAASSLLFLFFFFARFAVAELAFHGLNANCSSRLAAAQTSDSDTVVVMSWPLAHASHSRAATNL